MRREHWVEKWAWNGSRWWRRRIWQVGKHEGRVIGSMIVIHHITWHWCKEYFPSHNPIASPTQHPAQPRQPAQPIIRCLRKVDKLVSPDTMHLNRACGAHRSPEEGDVFFSSGQERGAEAWGSCFSLLTAGVLFLNSYAFCYCVLHSKALFATRIFFFLILLFFSWEIDLVLVKFLCNKTTVQAIHSAKPCSFHP